MFELFRMVTRNKASVVAPCFLSPCLSNTLRVGSTDPAGPLGPWHCRLGAMFGVAGWLRTSLAAFAPINHARTPK